MKVAIVDLETTGTDPIKHEIIEIGIVVFDSAKPEDTVTVNIKVKPTRLHDADPQAFKVNGFKEEDWRDALPLHDALEEVKKHCHGAIFMSYNVTFDHSFMREAYKASSLPDPFNYHRLCLMTFAWAKMPEAPTLKLKDMCERLGIPPEPEVHRALNGAKRAYELYRKLTST